MLAAVLAVTAVVGTAVPASAALQSGCALYATAPYDATNIIYFGSTASCGLSNAVITNVGAILQRSGTNVTPQASTSSSGSTTLRFSSTAGCSNGSYRTQAWASDKYTNAAEKYSAYVTITC